MRGIVIVLVSVALASGGCATKRYGRMQPLAAMEMTAYDCNGIALEQSKIDAFEDAIKAGSHINGASALGFLADYGIGNKMEKDAAEKSARERRQQLNMLAAQKNCAAR